MGENSIRADDLPDHGNVALDRLLAEGVEDDLYTGAVAAVGTADGIERLVTVGERDPDADAPVTEETLFDAASVTKPVVTTTVVLRLVEEGTIALSAPIGEYVEPLAGTNRGDLPLREFLTHTTGIQPYHYDPDWADPEAGRGDIYERELIVPGQHGEFEYSCLNFVHLADVARRRTGSTLSELASRYVFEPAGMERARLGPLEDDSLPVAVTYEREHADRELRGEIHDPIARGLEGESGNAGLFATGRDLARFTRALLADRTGDGPGILSPPTIGRMRENWLPEEQRPHGLGWRLAQDHYPASNWSRSSFGHTGYTGTSIWLDPEYDRFAVLLSNEVYRGKEQGMIRFRERFHGVVGGGRY